MAVAVPFAAPFVYLLIRNLSDAGAAWDAITDGGLVGPAARSLLLATSVSAASAVLGTGAAWLITRTDLPMRRLWAVLLPLPLVIPSFIGAVALIAAFSEGGLMEELIGVSGVSVSGFWGAFLVLTLLSYPYVYLPAVARLRTLPRPLEESSRLLGRSPAGGFLSVVLPQARGAIAAGALLAFLYVISDFGAVQLLQYDTLTRAIYANRLLAPEVSLALSLLLGVIALLVVALERRAARVGRRDAGRSERPMLMHLGRWRWPAAGGLGTLIGAALVAPVAVLGYWAVQGIARGSRRENAIVNDPGRLVEPLVNTAGVSVAAAVVAVLVVLPIAYATVRRPGRLGEAVAGVVVGGFALPGLVTALALVFWTLNAPGPIGGLYQTLPLLITAYVIHHGALALGTAQTALAGVPPRLEDAARALGSGRLRRLLTVELPLMAPGLAAGGGLVLLSTMKELPATLLLAPPGFQTLATKVWSSAENAIYEEASIAALVLIALSAVLTWLLVVRPSVRGRREG